MSVHSLLVRPVTLPPMAMLADDRRRAGWSIARAAHELGVSIRTYRELEAGTRWPNWETYDRICKLFGWPQTFTSEPGAS